MSALLFCDGWDKYGPPGNTGWTSVFPGDWASLNAAASIAPGLSATGYAISFPAGAQMQTNTFPAVARIAGSLRFNLASSAGSAYIQLLNGGVAGFTIDLSTAAGVRIRAGVSSGTILASGGSLTALTTHVLSFDVVVGAAALFTVFLDGVQIFTGTGNTAASQTVMSSAILVSASMVTVFDDLCLFDPSNAAYNSSVLTNNVVVETSFPSSDAQTQFVNDANVVWPTGIAANGVYSATGTIAGVAVNSLYLMKFTPTVNCTLNSISLGGNAATLATSKWRMVAYSDSAGAPGTLLSSGTEMVGITANTILTGPLTTPQALTAGVPVWLGFINDTAASNLRQVDTTSLLGRRIANTYTSGAPGTAGAMTAGQATFWMWGNCTGAAVNWPSVGLNPPLGTAQSQAHSATVGQEDLYGFPALVTTPSTIYGVSVKGFVSKSDSGARTLSINTKSGASDSTGSAPSQALSTTPQWQRTFYDVDPATGVAWTQSGLNAAKSGVSVAS